VDDGKYHGPPQRSVLAPSGGSARSLLLTVLGELVVPTGEPVWTATLLYAFAGLGVNTYAARQTIARAAEAGWIDSDKQGRATRWSVTPTALEIIEETTRRVMSLNAPPRRWDGSCAILIVTIGGEKKATRRPLYRALSWAGFGNPAPGLWVSPYLDRLEEAAEAIEYFGLRDSAYAFAGTPAQAGLTYPEIVTRAWDLDSVAARYARLLETYSHRQPECGDELLFTHLSLIEEWRRFPSLDPQLPQDLLPDWIGRRAADTFVELHRKWYPGAHRHWRHVIHTTAPDRA
jgi:phenylacetic acid degradation operon negative regulatory protein